MSQDEKPSRQLSVAMDEEGMEESTNPSEKKENYKVIADIHSGMVLVAPVATPPDEDEEAEMSEPRGPLN